MDELSFYKIVKKYNITSLDPKDIRSEFNRIRGEIHPDKQSLNGKFATTEDEKNFLEISATIAFIDEKKPEEITAIVERTTSIELIEITQNKTLEAIKDLQKSIIISAERTNYRNALSQSINQSINNTTYSNFVPKVTLSLVSVILSFIWFFPSTINNSPLSRFIDTISPLFTVLWLEILLITGIFWYFALISDNFERKLISKLIDETFQNEFFMHFVRERNAIREENKDGFELAGLFMAENLINYLQLHFYMTLKKSSLFFFKYSPYLGGYWDLGEKEDDIEYYQLYKLESDYETSSKTIYGIVDGKITFSGLTRLDKQPSFNFLNRLLLKNLDNNLDQETIQTFIKNILLKAEERGIIRSTRTYSLRTFGDIYKINDSFFHK